MKKRIVCPNCEAKFDEGMACCPYCNTMYYPGAEKEYMEKMEGIRQDYEDLTVAMDQMVAEEVRCQRLFWTSVVAIIITVLFVAFILYKRNIAVDEREQLKEQFWWRYENNAVMEELHYQGEHDKVLDIMNEGRRLKCYSYKWELAYYYEIYEAVALIEEVEKMESQGLEVDRDTLINLLAKEVEAVFALEYDDYTPEQRAKLEPLVEIAQEDFYTRWPMSEQDHQELHDMLQANYYVWIEPEQSEQFIDKWYGEK